MEPERVEENPPSTEPQTSLEFPPPSQANIESSELTQEKKDSCKLLLLFNK